MAWAVARWGWQAATAACRPIDDKRGTIVFRKRVAGVIYNRLEEGMPLQIDATILYGLQEWRRLTYDDYRNVESPYNTYKFVGLPPGPICSPAPHLLQSSSSTAPSRWGWRSDPRSACSSWTS